ncbi:unnamed protein product [Allacma fusca]|uniref:CDAN1-interacting nuclease 1 n=1 Tax=Allacma fusca TaxID=39272 RepID=A0A8J2PB83_9HEXA|nr:unnamed protein product [Allacma fusca]
MISKKLYDEILTSISETSLQNAHSRLEEKYPTVSPLTLGSILGNYVQRKMKKTHASHNNSEKITAYYEEYENAVVKKEPPGIIVRMAANAELCPTLMARFVLEGYLRSQQQQRTMRHKESKKDTAESSNTPTRVPPINLMALKSEVSRLIKDTTEIENPNLSYEVHLCTIHDSFYGPLPDAIKNAVGREYEVILEEKLKELKILYIDEQELRKRGYDKTPDFKLELPIGIDGKIVNWVESKATFGDEETHRGYMEDQLISYKNRYGPGLVIYWLGHVDTLDDSSISASGIMIRENMPTNIVHMDTNWEWEDLPSKLSDTRLK